ncbi:MAG TPA: signal peptidase I [Telluria sp.]|nr:signal peptidase I [Telluria sp.]
MKNWVRSNKGFIVFLALLGIFRTAVADWNPIPSASMHPNLLEGDVVFVNRLAFDLKLPLTDVVLTRLGEPRRGDVVTFSAPDDGTRTIKRILAVPGDKVEMRNGLVVINGQPASYAALSQQFETLPEGSTTPALVLSETVGDAHHEIQLLPYVEARRSFKPLVVPANQYMMLGDNRDNSRDSRYMGLVSRELLIGRAERVLVSADIRGNWMPRTERFGKSLR